MARPKSRADRATWRWSVAIHVRLPESAQFDAEVPAGFPSRKAPLGLAGGWGGGHSPGGRAGSPLRRPRSGLASDMEKFRSGISAVEGKSSRGSCADFTSRVKHARGRSKRNCNGEMNVDAPASSAPSGAELFRAVQWLRTPQVGISREQPTGHNRARPSLHLTLWL